MQEWSRRNTKRSQNDSENPQNGLKQHQIDSGLANKLRQNKHRMTQNDHRMTQNDYKVITHQPQTKPW